jgi:hypothetical protein
MKQKNPHVFRNIKINLKQFSNLIREYESVEPFSAMNRMIAERESAEKRKEIETRKN